MPTRLQCQRRASAIRSRSSAEVGVSCRSIGQAIPNMRLSLPKRHPEINLHYSWFKFPVLADRFPVPSQEFTVLPSREFRSKPLNLLACRLSESRLASGFDEIPC